MAGKISRFSVPEKEVREAVGWVGGGGQQDAGSGGGGGHRGCSRPRKKLSLTADVMGGSAKDQFIV